MRKSRQLGSEAMKWAKPPVAKRAPLFAANTTERGPPVGLKRSPSTMDALATRVNHRRGRKRRRDVASETLALLEPLATAGEKWPAP
ncbi:hypothetical protein AYO39_01620 [Actinobacteria bacterium SCGC AG-212-D09]|nr:hypothetical protein AYO39_01620 [Actinobacteria bacterium SCGC AG-212-D09]